MNLQTTLLYLALAMPTIASSSDCANHMLTEDRARDAKSVVIFRLVRAELIPSDVADASAWEVSGDVEVISALRGPGTVLKRIRYPISQFCGSRLEVGAYYAGFFAEASAEAQAHNGNLIAAGPWYVPGEHDTWLQGIESLIAGEARLDSVVPENLRSRLEMIPPPPPPPCCKTCRPPQE